MLSLRDTQLRFLAALYENTDAVISPAVRERHAEDRIGIYRNNLREGFIKTLALEFPVIQRLVGEDFFRQTAREYQLRHPSRRGDLSHVGEAFPEFLREHFGTGDYAYLPEVAELEWALQLVAIAPEATGITPADLADVDPARYADLVFEPHLATRLVQSRFPIVRIWQSNQPDADPEPIDLDSGGDHVLVRRRGDDMEFVRLSEADFTFARMLARLTPLGLAADASLAVDAAFDLPRSLRSLTLAGAFARAGLHD